MNIELFKLDDERGYYGQLIESHFRIIAASPVPPQGEYGLLLHPEMYHRIHRELQSKFQIYYQSESDTRKIQTPYGLLIMYRSYDIDAAHYKIFLL